MMVSTNGAIVASGDVTGKPGGTTSAATFFIGGGGTKVKGRLRRQLWAIGGEDFYPKIFW